MRILLRLITRTRSGRRAVREQMVEVERATVGRGTDNLLQLSALTVALHHCALEERDRRLYLATMEAPEVVVNGRARTGGPLAPGDVLRIGHHELRVGPGTTDGGFELELEEVAPPASEIDDLRRHTRMGIERGLFSRRALSWMALTVMLVVCAAPLLVRGRTAASGPAPAARPPVVRRLETLWSSGPLALAHRPLPQRCEACHSEPFAPVSDAACEQCHRATARHAPHEVSVPALENTRCAACHPEHRGRRVLVASASEPCLRCHATLRRELPGTALEDVTGFANGHPEFRLTVPGDAGCERLAVGAPHAPSASEDAAEPLLLRAGLRFSHAVHLRPGLRGKLGANHAVVQRALVSRNCHVPEADGAVMQPISFEAHCQSCHSLVFSELDPDHEAPHAGPERVRHDVETFFAARALLGDAAGDIPVLARRQPGADWDERQRPLLLAWARERTRRAWEDLLGQPNDGTCGVCHLIAHDADAVTVRPVLLAGAPDRCGPASPASSGGDAVRWMPLAEFRHASHAAVECSTCHDVGSAHAGMLPGIATCKPCHRSGIGEERRALADCVVCHRFHDARHGPMHPEAETATAR